MFKVFAHKGYQTTFSNGYTVSVMFGSGNYCEHRFNESVEPMGNTVNVWGKHLSNDAEVAVINPNGELIGGFPGCPDCDTVRGWCSPEEVLEIMNWASKL
jgi:hypothetical protein